MYSVRSVEMSFAIASSPRFRQRVAYMPQSPYLYSVTIILPALFGLKPKMEYESLHKDMGGRTLWNKRLNVV